MNVGAMVSSASTEVASPVKPGYEPPGMMEVRDKYGQLKEVMGTFNDKVSKVLSDAENQFLQAYRAHMTDVHRELQLLRSKLAEAETSLQKDEQVSEFGEPPPGVPGVHTRPPTNTTPQPLRARSCARKAFRSLIRTATDCAHSPRSRASSRAPSAPPILSR